MADIVIDEAKFRERTPFARSGPAYRLQGSVARLPGRVRRALIWAIYLSLVALIFVMGSLPMWWQL
ncbi:hypothetical protein [Rhizobium mongolense]|uniref:Uncharacterized protein n=1 Tax=Rhizobium mongolense TaxID=57676 RepID=A0ABR6IUU8_9HYPH|nr:hypothetical protein [Rhizobium mongolense]MBB4231674.1 hypothetical protein [Rhizobium mongolense]